MQISSRISSVVHGNNNKKLNKFVFFKMKKPGYNVFCRRQHIFFADDCNFEVPPFSWKHFFIVSHKFSLKPRIRWFFFAIISKSKNPTPTVPGRLLGTPNSTNGAASVQLRSCERSALSATSSASRARTTCSASIWALRCSGKWTSHPTCWPQPSPPHARAPDLDDVVWHVHYRRKRSQSGIMTAS